MEKASSECSKIFHIIYGLITGHSCAALGLLKTGKPVTLVADAIQTLKAEDSERTLREIRQVGGRVKTVGEMIS